jgi:hypothetical protein
MLRTRRARLVGRAIAVVSLLLFGWQASSANAAAARVPLHCQV